MLSSCTGLGGENGRALGQVARGPRSSSYRLTVFGLKSLDSCIFKEPMESSCAVLPFCLSVSEPTLPSFRPALGCPFFFFFLLKSF